MKNIAVVGANGKMGSLLCEKLKNTYIVTKITKEAPLEKINISKHKIDLVIDFASADSSEKSANYCMQYKIPLIIASTGQTETQLINIKNVSKFIPLIIEPNLSIGINLLKDIQNYLINKIKTFENYDINIHEKHHKEKKDSPSGTAILLKNYIQKISNKEIPITSERGGKEVGTHTVNFYFNSELISITHQAFSRDSFIDGTLICIDFLLKQKLPKLYSFSEILNNKNYN
ncbi:MAG: hypothetical protein IJX17_05180 [Clostridia bacterium]|nr:hypothetical protein [Clostridia bacterium]